MLRKLLISEFALLLLLTLNALLVFYFGDQIPDNAFLINSNNLGHPYISYFFSSFVFALYKVSGPWIFIPTLLFFYPSLTIETVNLFLKIIF